MLVWKMMHREDSHRKGRFRCTPPLPTLPIKTETASLRDWVILESNPRHLSNQTRSYREGNIAICSRRLQCGNIWVFSRDGKSVSVSPVTVNGLQDSRITAQGAVERAVSARRCLDFRWSHCCFGPVRGHNRFNACRDGGFTWLSSVLPQIW